jgi:DNA polymerase-1
VVATSDRDSFGLISKATSVLRLGSGLDNAMLIGPGELRERYGVGADQYLDYAALRGDSSDNLVGIRGVGERTAAKLLDRFGTLDAALDDASGLVDCVGPRLAGLLTSDDGRATITKNRDIMALTRNLLVDLGGCRLPLDQSLVAESLGRYELDKLISRAISQMCAPVLGDVEAYADEPYDRAIDETEIELLIREAEAADRLAGGVVVPEHIRAWDDNTLF